MLFMTEIAADLIWVSGTVPIAWAIFGRYLAASGSGGNCGTIVSQFKV
jgi:hypothetical protein